MYPHNIIMELLAEGGLIALTIFIFLVRSLWKLLKSSFGYFPVHMNKFFFSMLLLGLLTSMSSLDFPNQFIFFLSLNLIVSQNVILRRIKTTE